MRQALSGVTIAMIAAWLIVGLLFLFIVGYGLGKAHVLLRKAWRWMLRDSRWEKRE